MNSNAKDTILIARYPQRILLFFPRPGISAECFLGSSAEP